MEEIQRGHTKPYELSDSRWGAGGSGNTPQDMSLHKGDRQAWMSEAFVDSKN